MEGEVNGMMTYDRRWVRMNATMWKEDIQALYDTAEKRATEASLPLMNLRMGGLQYGIP